jgi:hypothetical protein
MGANTEVHTYRIVIRGLLGPRFGDVFSSMALEPANGGQALVGLVRDQAELRGMIDLLCGLGVEIVSVGPARGRPD